MRVLPASGRRVFGRWLVAFSVLAAAPVAAQERPAPPSPDLRAALDSPLIAQSVQLLPPAPALEHKRPSALIPLYISLVGLQALDIHSTRQGLRSGATRESNPLMKAFVENDSAFIAVKATTTAGTIFITEKLRKTRPKTAVVLAAALNIGMAAVVVNNYRVSRGR